MAPERQSDPLHRVVVTVDGEEYRMRLTTVELSRLRWALKPHLDGPGTPPEGSDTPRAARPTSPSDIRAWAALRGLNVSPYGRISDSVREAYRRELEGTH